MMIHHIGYLVDNLEATVKEFSKIGFIVERPKSYDSFRRIYICFIVNGGYRIELIEPEGIESPLYPLLKRYRNTAYHICYIVKDVAKAGEVLKENGYKVLQDSFEAPCIDGRQAVFLANLDIGVIELIEDKDMNDCTYDSFFVLNSTDVLHTSE